MSSNKRKTDFLGMPHGTAASRLRKLILFSILKKHGENLCYRCNKEIKTADDLTIDHKQPWEGIKIDLFWDLENISFSHRQCNRPHRTRGGGSKKKIFPPEGMAWCSEHKDFLPILSFDKGGKGNGLKDYCKECRSSRRIRGLGR